MTKKTKILLGVGIVAVASYYLWRKSQENKTKESFVNASGCKYVFGKSVSGKPSMVYETCPNKPPRLIRGL